MKNTRPVAVRLPNELANLMEAAAKAEGVTLSMHVRRFLESTYPKESVK